MLSYLLARLWKNPLARYGILAAAVLIGFSVIYSTRFQLHTVFYRLFNSPDWSDVARHAARPYAFEENEEKAQVLTQEAWSELYDLAREIIGTKKPKEKPVIGKVSKRPYKNFLHPHAEEEIFTLFNALAKDCGELRVSVKPSDLQNPQGEIADANTATGRAKTHWKETIEEILKIYRNKTEAALQKKPDYVPAIELAEEIFRAACSMREIAPLYARALDYREYALEKELYIADNGKLYARNPEEFHARAQELIRGDTQYREISIRHFEATRFRTPHHEAQLKNLRNAYWSLRNEKSVKALIQGLLAEARHSDTVTARKCHYELFALDYPGISDDPEYALALAETALRGGEYARARNIVGNLRKRKIAGDFRLSRDLERLAFQLELLLHESENLSRF